MTNNNETVWAWIQTKGRQYKVISNKEKGTIKVYNEKNEKVTERINLSKKQVEIFKRSHFFISFLCINFKISSLCFN